MSLEINRRSFLKWASFFTASLAAGFTLNPFGFLRKQPVLAAEIEPSEKYRWCFCDDIELKKLIISIRDVRHKNREIDPENVIAVVMGGVDKIHYQCVAECRYSNVKLLELGIDNALVKGIPVVSYADAKKLHKLNMLGKRI